MKTIVQLESFSSPFNQSLQKQLVRNSSFSEKCNLIVLNIEELKKRYSERYGKEYAPSSLLGVIRYWRGLNRFLEKEYRELNGELINIQMVIWQYSLLLPFLKKHFRRIVLSFWGSDILRTTKKELHFGKRLFDQAEIITYISDDMKERFTNVFGEKYSGKLRKVDFGSEILDHIDATDEDKITAFRKQYHVFENKQCLVIGYNRDKAQQHLEIIRSIIHHGIQPEEYFLLFPWTYGSEDADYMEQIERLIRGKFDYAFLVDRLSDEEVACLRKATDILIQTQITDAMSSTMLETLYAEKEIITGRWLHYDELDRAGVQMHYVDTVDEVGAAIREAAAKPLSDEGKTRNKEIIRKMSGWDYRINDWLGIYLSE